MSDTSTQGFGQQNDQGTGDQPQESGGIAPDFLKGIPEEDRPIVEKYVSEWDSQVGKKFQGIHSQYAPYKELGDVEQLQQAVAIANLLDTDPEQIYNALAEALGKSAPAAPGNGNQNGLANQLAPPQNLQVPQGLDTYLNPIQEQMAQQQKYIEQLSQIMVQNNQREREAQEDAQLNTVLSQLKEKHKVDFDEEAVLLQMYNGVDPDQAVENWKESVQKAAQALGLTSYSGPNPPPPLTGGSIPSQETSVKDMDNKDVKSLVANIMASAHQQ